NGASLQPSRRDALLHIRSLRMVNPHLVPSALRPCSYSALVTHHSCLSFPLAPDVASASILASTGSKETQPSAARASTASVSSPQEPASPSAPSATTTASVCSRPPRAATPTSACTASRTLP